ncbi:MAG TPA: VOC family protein [Gemmatimonadaceae bacterium]|nr:VOC family protein [Gemmatimonadaceae bacterium]
MRILTLHHVSLPVSDLERAKHFYETVLGLEPIPRPPFDFDGAWYRAGDRDVHLIVADRKATLRTGKGIDSHDVHFALRVANLEDALTHLERHGYTRDARDKHQRIRVQLAGKAGFPQIHLLDPDGNVVELNAEGRGNVGT